MYKSCKIRIYPNKEQERTILRHIGACRFVWNYMLNWQIENYKNGETLVSSNKMTALLPKLKNTEGYEWLKDISAASLQRECANLAYAYNQFFKHIAGYPKFKTRKHSKMAYPVAYDPFRFEEKYVIITKLGKVKYKTDYKFVTDPNMKFSNMQIQQDGDKYFLTVSYQCETQAIKLTRKSMGIDLGIKETATVSFGKDKFVYHNISKSKKMHELDRKIVLLSRSISRKYEHSRTGTYYKKTRNIVKQEAKLRKLIKHRTNIVKNYIHQTTHALVLMRPRRVVMEDLDVSEMLSNKHLRTNIGQACMKTFINQMKYKCEEYNIQFEQVPKFWPSSKTCSKCGNYKKNLKLSDRKYVCKKCGLRIDRDYNAAINLMKYKAPA